MGWKTSLGIGGFTNDCVKLVKKDLTHGKKFCYCYKQTGWFSGGGLRELDTKSLIMNISTALFQQHGYFVSNTISIKGV